MRASNSEGRAAFCIDERWNDLVGSMDPIGLKRLPIWDFAERASEKRLFFPALHVVFAWVVKSQTSKE